MGHSTPPGFQRRDESDEERMLLGEAPNGDLKKEIAFLGRKSNLPVLVQKLNHGYVQP
jgi:hypothetical protein